MVPAPADASAIRFGPALADKGKGHRLHAVDSQLSGKTNATGHLPRFAIGNQLARFDQRDNPCQQHQIAYLDVRFPVVSHGVAHKKPDLLPFCCRTLQKRRVEMINASRYKALLGHNPKWRVFFLQAPPTLPALSLS
jgi:hypothetical protein